MTDEKIMKKKTKLDMRFEHISKEFESSYGRYSNEQVFSMKTIGLLEEIRKLLTDIRKQK